MIKVKNVSSACIGIHEGESVTYIEPNETTECRISSDHPNVRSGDLMVVKSNKSPQKKKQGKA